MSNAFPITPFASSTAFRRSLSDLSGASSANASTLSSKLKGYTASGIQRDSIVAGRADFETVVRINIAVSGGSSKIFNKALNAPIDIFSAFGMI